MAFEREKRKPNINVVGRKWKSSFWPNACLFVFHDKAFTLSGMENEMEMKI